MSRFVWNDYGSCTWIAGIWLHIPICNLYPRHISIALPENIFSDCIYLCIRTYLCRFISIRYILKYNLYWYLYTVYSCTCIYVCVCVYILWAKHGEKETHNKSQCVRNVCKIGFGTTLLQTFNRSEAPNTCWSSPAQCLTWLQYSFRSTDMVWVDKSN